MALSNCRRKGSRQISSSGYVLPMRFSFHWRSNFLTVTLDMHSLWMYSWSTPWSFKRNNNTDFSWYCIYFHLYNWTSNSIQGVELSLRYQFFSQCTMAVSEQFLCALSPRNSVANPNELCQFKTSLETFLPSFLVLCLGTKTFSQLKIMQKTEMKLVSAHKTFCLGSLIRTKSPVRINPKRLLIILITLWSLSGIIKLYLS